MGGLQCHLEERESERECCKEFQREKKKKMNLYIYMSNKNGK